MEKRRQQFSINLYSLLNWTIKRVPTIHMILTRIPIPTSYFIPNGVIYILITIKNVRHV